MQTYANKKEENQSKVADDFSPMQSSNTSVFQFVNSRPEAAVQRKMQEVANHSRHARKIAQLQAKANDYAVDQPVQQKRNNTGLPDNLKTGIENLSGHSMDDVKVHYNSDKPAQLNAHAYAQGTDIHVATGQEKHLPHEAWHVVQQKQGRVKPTMQMRGKVNVNDDAGLEKEADVMGGKVISNKALTSFPADNPGLLKQVSIPYQKMTQGKWFRMSTLLNKRDLKEVKEINSLVKEKEFLQALWQIVVKYQDFQNVIIKIDKLSHKHQDVKQAVNKILEDTFNEPSRSYAVWEVVDLLINEIKGLGIELLNESKDTEDMEIDSSNPDQGVYSIENLISDFVKMAIPFQIEVNGVSKAHQLYLGKDNNENYDIIVESNPKPLKQVLLNGKWEGFQIKGGIKQQLHVLRQTAKRALYKIAGKKNKKGSRTIQNMNSFRNVLQQIVEILKTLSGQADSAKLIPPQTDLSQSDSFNNVTIKTEGTHVKARPLSIRSAKSGSSPKDGRLMKSIRKLAGDQRKSYVQMHLLNDLVFGPGELWNLTPGPKMSNSKMERSIEESLKKAILGKGLVINFEAVVNYNNDPNQASDKDIEQDPNKYRFQSINFRAEQLSYDPAIKTWIRANVQDPDVVNVNGGNVKWDYGSLKPLVPKPRILNQATTEAALISVGIAQGAAKRINAFVAAQPVWRPDKGLNKQMALARAVKNFDGHGMINITKWKSNDVLWT